MSPVVGWAFVKPYSLQTQRNADHLTCTEKKCAAVLCHCGLRYMRADAGARQTSTAFWRVRDEDDWRIGGFRERGVPSGMAHSAAAHP